MSMSEPVKVRYIGRYDVSDVFLILKIYQRGKKFKYTIQDGDGPTGKADTLCPWAESKFTFNSIEDAEEAAEWKISETENQEFSNGKEIFEIDISGVALALGNDDSIWYISYNYEDGPWHQLDAIGYNQAHEKYLEEVERRNA